MKNTWLHSALVVVIAAPIIGAAQHLAQSWAAIAADSATSLQALAMLTAEPMAALSSLLPGLLLGWFTRRHPLLVGAAAGALGAMLSHGKADPLSYAGAILASAMMVAVTTFAGRALRVRLQAQSSYSMRH